MAKKGTEFNDRKLAGDLRTITNRVALTILINYEDKAYTDPDDVQFAKEVLIKCLGSSLPRINEHSGPDGGAIPITGVDISFRE